MIYSTPTIFNFNFNLITELGCDKIIASLKQITRSDLFYYSTCPPWPNMKIRFDSLMQVLMRHKISNSKRILSNRRKTENQFEGKALNELNN